MVPLARRPSIRGRHRRLNLDVDDMGTGGLVSRRGLRREMEWMMIKLSRYSYMSKYVLDDVQLSKRSHSDRERLTNLVLGLRTQSC